MNCNGHVSITEDAFRLLFSRCGADVNSPSCDSRFALSNLNKYQGTYTGPDMKNGAACVAFAASSLYAAQMVAAVDINPAGHLLNAYQYFHFMRSAYESEATAHQRSCDFIRDQTTAFVHETIAELRKMPVARPNDPLVFWDQFGLPRTLTTMAPTAMGTATVIRHPFSRNPFFNPSRLARALHCLQDSFSPGHVERGKDRAMNKIHIYAEQDGDEHHRHDHHSGEVATSTERRNAVEASADLIELALKASLRMEMALTAWGPFAEKWLKAGSLSYATPPPPKVPAAGRGILFYTP